MMLMTMDNSMNSAYNCAAFGRRDGAWPVAADSGGARARWRCWSLAALFAGQLAVLAEAAEVPAASSDVDAGFAVNSSPATTPAMGTEYFFEELPVVLSASRLKQSINQAPAAVTVIDRDMIAASGARRIEELLRLVPGFYVGYVNGNSAIVGYHGLSDAYARRMQVLIDGVSIYSPLWGGIDWAELPLAVQNVERIEVVRGPNAVTYGANAFLGVINIITRDPATEPAYQLDANLGGNGVRDVTARLVRQGEGWRYRLTLGQRNDDGVAYLPDSAKIDIASLRAHYHLNPSDELAFQMRTSRGNETQGFYNTAIDDSAVRRPRDVRQNTAQLRWTRAQSADDEFWLQFYHYSHGAREYASFYVLLNGFPPIPYTAGFNYDVTRDDIEFQQSRKANDAVRLVWGGQWRTDSVRSHSFFHRDDDLDNRLTRLFGNVEWRPTEQLTLHGGTMFERNSMTGGSTSPRLAATWQVLPGHNLRAAVSRSNRAPTLYEQSANQTYDLPPALVPFGRGMAGKITVLSSGNLNDEEIRSREIGYVADVPQWRLGGDIRLFNDSIDRLIYSAGTHPVAALFNRKAIDYFNSAQGVHQRGYEVSLRWQPWSGAQINATAAYTRIDSVMPDTMQSAPMHTRNVLFRQALPHETSFSAGFYKVASMRWQSSPAGVPGYNTTDLRVAKQLRWGAQRAELALVTRNMLGAYRDYNLNNYERRISYVQLNLAY